MKPELECDLVMKGGITSGVIYPLAIVELAKHYRLRRIGGASAGAIAAGAAAAAELGRDAGKAGSGFEGLADLPSLISAPVKDGGPSRLLTLFQPSTDATPLFELLLAVLDKKGVGGRVAVSLLGAAPGAWLAVLLTGAGLALAGEWLSAALAALLLTLVALGLSAYGLVQQLLKATDAEHNFGLCPGYAKDSEHAPLTTWLSQLFNRLAGRAENDAPVTCGELEQAGLTVEVMTTNLTHGRPYRLPMREGYGTYFFKRSELEALFPPNVVEHIVKAAPADAHFAANPDPEVYVPFPGERSLPLVVAVRMSLSFPVLLQAVPLYAVDHSRKEPRLERCWFSDGGICSNLPLHFFDVLLPSRPTFALDLGLAHPDHPEVNVYLPEGNARGLHERWQRFEDQGVIGFLMAMVDTMMNWNDRVTSKYPGYRDRIARIHHTEQEGGLNLNMPAETIIDLSKRGALAGQLLAERFTSATAFNGQNGWKNHQWVRYRAMLSMLSGQLESLGRVGTLASVAEFPSHPFAAGAREQVSAVNTALVELHARLQAAGDLLHDKTAPHPLAELKARPRA